MTIINDLMKTAPFEMGIGIGGVVTGVSCLCSLCLILGYGIPMIYTDQPLDVTRLLMENKGLIISLTYAFCFIIFLGWGGLMAAIVKTIKHTDQTTNNDV